LFFLEIFVRSQLMILFLLFMVADEDTVEETQEGMACRPKGWYEKT